MRILACFLSFGPDLFNGYSEMPNAKVPYYTDRSKDYDKIVLFKGLPQHVSRGIEKNKCSPCLLVLL